MFRGGRSSLLFFFFKNLSASKTFSPKTSITTCLIIPDTLSSIFSAGEVPKDCTASAIVFSSSQCG